MKSPALQQGTNRTQLASINRELQFIGCQVSPLVLKIRDDGPAILDGECQHELPETLLGLSAANQPTGLITEHSASRRLRRRHSLMLAATLLLTFSLTCVAYYAWKQKSQVNELEAELALMKAAEEENF